MNGSDNGGPEEQGNLGLWSVISIIVGIVIGASIFKIPWLIFLNVPDPWSGLIVWALGGVLALVGAFCYAELATTYPRAGGDYVYLTRAFGPWCGFLFGWAQLSVLLPAAIAGMAAVFAEFATTIHRLDDYTGMGLSSEFSYAIVAVSVLSLLNILGVTLGKFAQNLLTFAKVVGVLAIIVVGFGWPGVNPLEWQFADSIEALPPEWRFSNATTLGWGSLALILVLYAYGGWNDAAFVAAEVRNPRRNIPLALLLGVGMITFLYLLINAAYLIGLGFDDVRTPPGEGWVPVPARLLGKAFGEYGVKAMSIIVMISALGAVNGLIFTGARVYATLGNDHPLFGWLGFWRPGHGAPILGLIVQALVTVAMLFAIMTGEGQHYINEALAIVGIERVEQWNVERAFDQFVAHTAPVFWTFFLATAFSLFALRTRDANRDRPFPVPLYPVLPFIFCNMCLYMLYQSSVYVGWRALLAVGLVLLGLPLYWLSRAIGYHRQAED
jgi:amino acid transporter